MALERKRRSVGVQIQELESRAGLGCDSLVCSLEGRQECKGTIDASLRKRSRCWGTPLSQPTAGRLQRRLGLDVRVQGRAQLEAEGGTEKSARAVSFKKKTTGFLASALWHFSQVILCCWGLSCAL